MVYDVLGIEPDRVGEVPTLSGLRSHEPEVAGQVCCVGQSENRFSVDCLIEDPCRGSLRMREGVAAALTLNGTAFSLVRCGLPLDETVLTFSLDAARTFFEVSCVLRLAERSCYRFGAFCRFGASCGKTWNERKRRKTSLQVQMCRVFDGGGFKWVGLLHRESNRSSRIVA